MSFARSSDGRSDPEAGEWRGGAEEEETMTTLVYVLSGLAIVLMGIDVWKALELKAALSRGEMGRGEVGKKWTLLTFLLVFFFVGYLASPLLLSLKLDPQVVNLVVFLVFLFGAAFVYVVVGILRDVLTFLDLLK
jgi:hypothetical protein